VWIETKPLVEAIRGARVVQDNVGVDVGRQRRYFSRMLLHKNARLRLPGWLIIPLMLAFALPPSATAQTPTTPAKKPTVTRQQDRIFNVRQGETLLMYARWTGFKIAEVRRRLGLGPKEGLRKGRILFFRLSGKRWNRFRRARRKFSESQSVKVKIAQRAQGTSLHVHEVQKGETASRIAQNYHTSVAILRSLNGGRKLDPVYPGEILRIPDNPVPVPARAALPTLRPSLGSGALTIRIAAGETLSHLAQFAEIPAELILQVNDIPDPDMLTRGSPLQIPIPRAKWSRFTKRRERFHDQQRKPETPRSPR